MQDDNKCNAGKWPSKQWSSSIEVPGLSLVAKIVADHRGVVSYLPGEPGSTFRVRLPAARQHQQPDLRREVA